MNHLHEIKSISPLRVRFWCRRDWFLILKSSVFISYANKGVFCCTLTSLYTLHSMYGAPPKSISNDTGDKNVLCMASYDVCVRVVHPWTVDFFQVVLEKLINLRSPLFFVWIAYWRSSTYFLYLLKLNDDDKGDFVHSKTCV